MSKYQLCSSRFTVVEAHLHVTASLKKSVTRLVCNCHSFEKYCTTHHSDSGAVGQHPASAHFFFIVISSIVLIPQSSFTTYLLMRVMGIAKPIWTVNKVEQ